MKVINFESVVKPEYKEQYLTMDTGHVATLVEFIDGDNTIEEMHLHTKTGKRVVKNNTVWKKAEDAIFKTNPSRSKW